MWDRVAVMHQAVKGKVVLLVKTDQPLARDVLGGQMKSNRSHK